MDLANIVHAIRSIRSDETLVHLERKFNASLQAYKKLEKIGVTTSYDDFLLRTSDQVLNTYFGSDGVDVITR